MFLFFMLLEYFDWPACLLPAHIILPAESFWVAQLSKNRPCPLEIKDKVVMLQSSNEKMSFLPEGRYRILRFQRNQD